MPPQSSASSSWWESCLIDVSRYFWSKTLARALLPISFVEIALRLLRTSVAVFRAVAAGVALAMVADFPRDVVRNGSMPPRHFFFKVTGGGPTWTSIGRVGLNSSHFRV